MRLYRGDLVLGVFGNRYATDAFEGEVISTSKLSLLTGAGMVGSVCSVHRQCQRPTKLAFRGLLVDENHQVVNLKERLFPRPSVPPARLNVVLLIGSGMDTGKTTVAARLVRALSARRLSVAACKLTGSVSHQDQLELRSAVACQVRDFSDYGFPSTYLCSREELLDLFHVMLADVERSRPDVIIMEIADGILQRETDILIREQALHERSLGVVFTAPCASSALYGVERLQALNHRVLAVSGVVTNSPLYVRELESNSSVPVRSSFGNRLAEVIGERLRAEPSEACVMEP
jgi:dethiobiotin synthetase